MPAIYDGIPATGLVRIPLPGLLLILHFFSFILLLTIRNTHRVLYQKHCLNLIHSLPRYSLLRPSCNNLSLSSTIIEQKPNSRLIRKARPSSASLTYASPEGSPGLLYQSQVDQVIGPLDIHQKWFRSSSSSFRKRPVTYTRDLISLIYIVEVTFHSPITPRSDLSSTSSRPLQCLQPIVPVFISFSQTIPRAALVIPLNPISACPGILLGHSLLLSSKSLIPHRTLSYAVKLNTH